MYFPRDFAFKEYNYIFFFLRLSSYFASVKCNWLDCGLVYSCYIDHPLNFVLRQVGFHLFSIFLYYLHINIIFFLDSHAITYVTNYINVNGVVYMLSIKDQFTPYRCMSTLLTTNITGNELDARSTTTQYTHKCKFR